MAEFSTPEFSIVFVSHYTDLYGANRSMLNLITGLQQTGISDISVIVPSEGDVCIELKKKSIRYYTIAFVHEVYDYTRPQSHLKKLAKKYYNFLLVALHKHRFKNKKNLIVHTNTSITFFGAYLAAGLNAKHVWHIREFGKPDYNLVYNFGDEYFYKWLNKASAVLCISNALFNYRLNNTTNPFTKVIYNGVVPDAAVLNNVSAFSKNKILRFGISGHISHEKNQEEAIKAIQLVQKEFKCELIIAGTGDDAVVNALKAYTKKHALENSITFTGFINDINQFYTTLDCVLVCAKNEALGRVTIEAMSCGLPVIGFNHAGTAEIIQDGFNGLLYNNGHEQLAEKMKLLILNYESFTNMRSHALYTVKEKFTIEKCTDAVCNIYKTITVKAS